MACDSEKDVSIEYYTCSMHPKIKMDNPGQCPICGMDLTAVKKVSQDDHSGHQEDKKNGDRIVRIDPTYIQNIGVKTEVVTIRDLTQVISTYGKVAHDNKLWVAQNEYIEALKIRDKSLIKASERKLQFLGLSDQWIQALKKSKKADISLHLESTKEEPTFFEAYVYQDDIGMVKEGLDVVITDQNGRYLETGKVKAMGTLVDLDSRSIRILVESPKPLNLKSNTFVQIKIKVPLGRKLSVFDSAILFNGDHNMVYIEKAKGVYKPRVIQLGDQAGNYYAVKSGLSDGDVVVTNGHFLIDSESQIKFGGSSNDVCPEGERWDAGMSMCMKKN